MDPNRQRAVEMYRHLAGSYDRRVRAAQGVREWAVERLRLKPGDTVFDVGCGTGLSFPLIVPRIGAEGRLIGLDQSPEMLQKARERIEGEGWSNVTLVQSAIEDAEVPAQADAVFFHFTHDIMRSPPALENVLRHTKPGATVVAAGGKWAPWWRVPVNLVIWRISRRYVTTFEGFGRPWSHLEGYLLDIRLEDALFGAGYIVSGTTGG